MPDRFGTISINPEAEIPPQHSREQKPRPKPGRRPTSKRSAPAHKKTSRWIYLPAALVLLISAYAAGGFLLAPSLLTRYISDSLRQTADIGLTAGEARFNPFTLQLQLRNVATTGTTQTPAPAAALLHMDHFLIDLDLIALLRNGLACNRLEIQGLTLSLIRYPNKTYNLPELVPADTAGTEPEHLSLSRLPLLFSLNNIKISDSRILFDDRLTGKKHWVEQIKLDIPTLSNFPFAAKEYIRPHFSAVINGSPLELTGEAALPGENGQEGMKTKLSCTIQNLDLPLYLAYLPTPVPLVLGKGKAQGKIQISFIPKDKKGGHLTVGFQLTTTGIELANTEQTLSMTAPTIEIQGDLQPLNGALHLQKLHLLQPRFAADQAHFSRDMAHLFAGPAATQETTQHRHHLDIDSLIVENGTLQLVALNPSMERATLGHPWSARNTEQQDPDPPPWTAIELNVKSFSTAPDQPRDKGTFALSARQEKTNAALTWQGSFNGRGVPDGALQLDHIQAATLLSCIDPAQATEASGSGALRGHLTFDPTAQSPSMASLINATAEIHDLTLLDRKKAWLSAKTVQIKSMKIKEDSLDLGTISLAEGSLTLHQDKLPPFLQGLGDRKRPTLIQGLDFSGNVTLYPQKEKAPPLQLVELHLKASNLTARSDNQNNFDLAARVNEAGMLKAQGLTTLFPLRASLSLVFTALTAEQVAPWLPDAPLFQQSRATVQGQGTYRYPESSFSGTLQLSDALIGASTESPGLAFSKAELTEVTITTKPLGINMNELILKDPKLTWQQDTDSPGAMARIGSFLQNLVSHPPDKETRQKDGGNPALPAIQKISVDNGTVSYVDQRLNPPWSSEISQVKGSITNLREKAEAGPTFELSGLVDTVPFTLAGSADLLTSQGNFTTRLELKGFPLLPLAAQIRPLLDINPESGSFDLSLNHSRHNGDEQGEAAFLFSALRPASAQSDTALVLALLGDSRDQLKLLVPLAKDSPQPLFEQTVASFRPLIVKAEVTPFLLAGEEFTDLQDRQSVQFPAGKSELDASGDGQESLQRFAALLVAHPHLGLTLTGMADPIHDREAIQKIREEKEKKRVALLNEQRLEKWQKIQQQKRQTPPQAPSQAPPQGKIIEQDIPARELAPPAPLTPEPVTVSDATLQDLAQERALQVYDFYAAVPGIAAERITLQEKSRMSTPETPGNQVLIGLRYVEQAEP